MHAPRSSRLHGALFGVLLAVCAGTAVADEKTYVGEATGSAGTVLYTERHRISTVEGRTTESLTEYRAPDGKLIATMASDYSRSVAMPTYVFEDLQRHYREGLRWENGTYVIFYQQDGSPEKTSTLTGDSRLFSCQGWHYFLVNNLDLLEKDNLVLNLILPSELRPYPFVVKKLASDESRVSAELSLKHWLYRYFAPKLRLDYDRKLRRLVEFHGVSNIPDKAGDRQVVTIRYRYDD